MGKAGNIYSSKEACPSELLICIAHLSVRMNIKILQHYFCSHWFGSPPSASFFVAVIGNDCDDGTRFSLRVELFSNTM